MSLRLKAAPLNFLTSQCQLRVLQRRLALWEHESAFVVLYDGIVSYSNLTISPTRSAVIGLETRIDSAVLSLSVFSTEKSWDKLNVLRRVATLRSREIVCKFKFEIYMKPIRMYDFIATSSYSNIYKSLKKTRRNRKLQRELQIEATAKLLKKKPVFT